MNITYSSPAHPLFIVFAEHLARQNSKSIRVKQGAAVISASLARTEKLDFDSHKAFIHSPNL